MESLTVGVTVPTEMLPKHEVEELRRNAERWQAMRQTLVAADFAPEMGGGPVVMFSCHAERVGFGPEGADAIADAAVAALRR